MLENLTKSDNLSLRFRYYQTGPALSLLLDTLAGNGWKQRMLDDNATLQDELGIASGVDAVAIAAQAIVGRDLGACGLEHVAVYNRRMLCRADLTLEIDFSDVETVPQEISERASGEGNAANGPSIREMADFGDDAALPKVTQEQPDTAEVG